jgi:arylsulfatase A-like enzyme
VEVLPGQKDNTFSLMRQLRVRPPPRHLGELRAKLADGGVDLYDPISPTFDIPNSTAPNFNEADVTDKPSWLQNGPTGMGGWPVLSAQEIQYQRRQSLDRMESMLAVDDMVGTLYAELDKDGIRSSTVFVLTSDNGFSLGAHRLNNKMFPYEEDIRVPLVVSCNAPGQGKDDHMVSNIDLAETITDYAMTPWTQDGRSFRPLLEGQTVPSWRTRLLVEHWFDPKGPIFNDLPDHAIVRTDKNDPNPLQKYIGYYGLTGQLNQSASPIEIEQYDFATDPWEDDNSVNVASEQAARTALGPKLQALRTCSGATCRTADSN